MLSEPAAFPFSAFSLKPKAWVLLYISEWPLARGMGTENARHCKAEGPGALCVQGWLQPLQLGWDRSSSALSPCRAQLCSLWEPFCPQVLILGYPSCSWGCCLASPAVPRSLCRGAAELRCIRTSLRCCQSLDFPPDLGCPQDRRCFNAEPFSPKLRVDSLLVGRGEGLSSQNQNILFLQAQIHTLHPNQH